MHQPQYNCTISTERCISPRKQVICSEKKPTKADQRSSSTRLTMGQYFSSSGQPVAEQYAGSGAAATAAGGGFKWQEQQPEKTAARPRRSRKAMRHAYDASSQDDLVLVVSLDTITKIG
ncbi:hypothetical protein E2562_013718 [Oryza meyeriana var. granulata]|uniref:Uncharacterized protein n=1 Tax=Oryza meyeriana var. granulata TaxID=110450 RepID=A0A6G1BK87_9ORYZ|nr:hypothetical protein E2562_013718 [Oryza meyeriana var. granulata]KAF0888273.1 hypothetical protein E2562_013718 [Oryza meyeriana var. granulata]KAF0888274.1 hypothetical protein E2562_013718 [Oryza meyeriana var. granulata]